MKYVEHEMIGDVQYSCVMCKASSAVTYMLLNVFTESHMVCGVLSLYSDCFSGLSLL